MKAVTENRWRYAQRKEVDYQRAKIRRLGGATRPLAELSRAKTTRVLQLLDQLGVAAGSDAVVLEIGCGAHGLIWHWPARCAVALDPLAHFYRQALDFQRAGAALSIQAMGERMPLGTATVDLVVTENVLDHTQDPAAIIAEIRRVLRPGGVLYCLVDVHHWIWSLGAGLYNGLFSLGLKLHIPAYPHHPFHFRRDEFLSMFGNDCFDVLHAVTHHTDAAPTYPPQTPSWRHTLKQWFPKNIGLEIVAVANN